MASQKILGLREHSARNSIAETIDKAKTAGVEIGDLTPNHRFPDVGRVEELEYFDSAFSELVAALAKSEAEVKSLKAAAKKPVKAEK